MENAGLKEQVEQLTGAVREKDAELSRLEGAWAAERTELTQKGAALEVFCDMFVMEFSKPD